MDKRKAVLKIGISKLKPANSWPNGATMGEAHAVQIRKLIAEATATGVEVVILDFIGIESASASYLKRLLNPFFSVGDTAGGFSQEVSPIGINVDSTDLEEDLEEYLAGKSRALIVADIVKEEPRFNRLLGRLDGAAAETFKELRQLKTATAAQLYERHREQTTNQTAWNNRLAQLVEMRLASRCREGRIWIYQPTVKS